MDHDGHAGICLLNQVVKSVTETTQETPTTRATLVKIFFFKKCQRPLRWRKHRGWLRGSDELAGDDW